MGAFKTSFVLLLMLLPLSCVWQKDFNAYRCDSAHLSCPENYYCDLDKSRCLACVDNPEHTSCVQLCGNGVVDAGEGCDEGEANSATGKCSEECLRLTCGDGERDEVVEECDYGKEDSAECNGTGAGTRQCTVPKCGDSYTNHAAGEECDDGNEVDADGCSGKCVIEEGWDCSYDEVLGRSVCSVVCGDGKQVGHEECDDGNQINTDSCLNTCVEARCGDGVIGPGELCDEGDDNAEGAACNMTCTTVDCGNGIEDAGEECDDGNDSNRDTCLNTCVGASCGDGYIRADEEECDGDGEGSGGVTAMCDVDCTASLCGDGLVNSLADESCDDANSATSDACVQCVWASCGDGYICAGDTCADSNALSGPEDCDGGGTETQSCDIDCTYTSCGDGTTNTAAGEGCDDGNDDDTDTCTNSCEPARCGDGLLCSAQDCLTGPNNGAEECDDGNVTSGDGCSDACSVEDVTPVCGNGVLESGEECDVGQGNGIAGSCTKACTKIFLASLDIVPAEQTQDVEVQGLHHLNDCPGESGRYVLSENFLLLGHRQGMTDSDNLGPWNEMVTGMNDRVFGAVFDGSQESFAQEPWVYDGGAQMTSSTYFKDHLFLNINRDTNDQTSNQGQPIVEGMRTLPTGIVSVGEETCSGGNVETWSFPGRNMRPGTTHWLDTGLDEHGSLQDYFAWVGSIGGEDECYGSQCGPEEMGLGDMRDGDRAGLILGFPASAPEIEAEHLAGCATPANTDVFNEVEIEEMAYFASRDTTGHSCPGNGDETCEPHYRCESVDGHDDKICVPDDMPFVVAGEFSEFLPEQSTSVQACGQDGDIALGSSAESGVFLAQYTINENQEFIRNNVTHLFSNTPNGIGIKSLQVDVASQKVFLLLACTGSCTVFLRDSTKSEFDFGAEASGLMLLVYTYDDESGFAPEEAVLVWNAEGNSDSLSRHGTIEVKSLESDGGNIIVFGGCFHGKIGLATTSIEENSEWSSSTAEPTIILDAKGNSQDFFVARIRAFGSRALELVEDYTEAYGTRRRDECVAALYPVDGEGYRSTLVAGTHIAQGSGTGDPAQENDLSEAFKALELSEREHLFFGRTYHSAE